MSSFLVVVVVGGGGPDGPLGRFITSIFHLPLDLDTIAHSVTHSVTLKYLAFISGQVSECVTLDLCQAKIDMRCQ